MSIGNLKNGHKITYLFDQSGRKTTYFEDVQKDENMRFIFWGYFSRKEKKKFS